MAYNFYTEFTYTNGSAFPDTAAVNASGSGTADGTEFKKKFVDDWWGFVQAMLYNSGQTPSNTAELYNSSQVLNAVKLFAGVYTYVSGMTLKTGTRIMSPIPGDYMFYYVTGDATATNTADAIADFKTDLAAGKFQYHSARRGSKRQTNVQGSVDSSGKANFLKISGTGIQIDATPTPVVFTIASGYGPGGHPIDRTVVLTADDTPAAWDALANGTHYLYVDFNNGSETHGASDYRPSYGTVFPSAPASGQHHYSIDESKMYYWDGASWVHTERHFPGQATFSGGSPIEVRTYALNGYYDSGWFAVANTTNYTKYHDIGVELGMGVDTSFYFSLDSAGADASVAHDVFAFDASNYFGSFAREAVANTDTHIYIKFGFNQYVQGYTGGNRTTGYYRIIAHRSF
jgi:hypothetical protein